MSECSVGVDHRSPITGSEGGPSEEEDEEQEVKSRQDKTTQHKPGLEKVAGSRLG